MITDPLTTTLLDLHAAVSEPGFKLILGGGYGLYLRQIQLQNAQDVRTLLAGDLWPSPRATEDIDLFLPTEIVVSLASMQAIRTALDTIGFSPVAGVRFMHFTKPWHGIGDVKIDLLTGPIDDPAARNWLKIIPPRVRPRGDLELHAYLTNEAIDFELSLVRLTAEGTNSEGKKAIATIYVPQPFTFLLMKLHAFADRVADANRDLGRHHALDVYRIIAMLTSTDYDAVRGGILRNWSSPAVGRARQIVAEYFASPTALGLLRIREHVLFTKVMDVAVIIRTLGELFLEP